MPRFLNDTQNLRTEFWQDNAEQMRRKTLWIEGFRDLLGIIQNPA